MAKKDMLKEVVDKLWPKTKKELERGLENAKKMLAKGEEHIKEFSEKGAAKTKKLSLTLRKEKLYYDMGKTAIGTAASKWQESRKMQAILKEVKKIDRQIKSIK